ncbi:hypothetical protein E6C27_scaffold43573G00040 [Cucumis melo var. makuwa]|uniref:Uncharacterized protein n=1 Tax=Cucumis melo var. makuwa TaxID=1194695 RepID=A0A5A7SNC4_CUCMM|nr:hypothetical protein E6C27_scaffold43573G00040 [Cucumis melo var. makuwa]
MLLGSERKLVMLSATGLSPSRVQHSTASPSSTTLVLLSHNPVFTFARLSLACPWIQQQFERLTSGSTLICNSPKHFVADYALPRLWVPRYPPSAFLPLNLALHFKAMPSPRSGAAKWKDLINVHEFEIIDRTAESEKWISFSLYRLSERVGDKRTRTADIRHRRNSSLYLKRYRYVGWNPILTKDSCGSGESSYRRTRKGELFPMPSPSGGERPRAGYGSIPSP